MTYFVFSESVNLLKKKLFNEIIPPAGKDLTAFRPLNFCSAFLLYYQQSHPISSQPVEDPTLVTDLWLRRIIILCKTHLL